MKDRLDRTKAVLRHLPPAISQSVLMEQIDVRFGGRYNWFCFRPGKISQKNQRHAQAYIDFKSPEDVVEFAEVFDGHVFVNEKGAQFKTIVEYAPSQRIPKLWSKKDGREGTIFKDPEYLEFLDHLAKPAENLPSAEIQLERKEAEERAGGLKERLIVTPLMDFVRQKRAAKIGSQRPSANGKVSRRGGVSHGNSGSSSSKRASDKRRAPTSMYVLRESTKNSSSKEKSTYLLVSRRDDQQLSDKSVAVGAATGIEVVEDETGAGADHGTTGVSGAIEIGKKRLLLKGKEKEISLASGGVSQQQSVTPVRKSQGSATFKQNQRRDGRIIRSILSNKEGRQNQSSAAMVHPEQQIQTVSLEKDKRPPRSTNMRSILKDQISIVSPLADNPDSEIKRASDDKVFANDLHNIASASDKQDRRTRNKDRPDRGVWTPLRRSDGSHASDDILSSSLQVQYLSDSFEGMSISQQSAPGISKIGDDIAEGNNTFTSGKPRSMDGVYNSRLGRGGGLISANEFVLGEMKVDMLNAGRGGEIKVIGSGRNSLSSMENGSHRYAGRRGPSHGLKEVDASSTFSEGKPSKRGGATGHGSHEKQVWVQKSGSGS
ncbi:hypothetical protein MRB53_022783 [Persea americana]|uniref:Uncharacterized protein n=1 Tax=Persea americana TaxID=3435 RepID=A0ACC2L7Q1_PERAE|nr:hypothetical protein MRB53_022783 [Persea americana]|eukprot:TRINITY_DN1203_c0_g2_i5.p1 TRINITY_DN1203_c0_g2~~TRINITY_DN1203_c0_g2_i5.p1  ORF type:complete len:602 (-),score=155.32 TRINITY_DN1203_c0_g2_i5:1017-2822(-)